MKAMAYVTGLTGTVAPFLVRALKTRGYATGGHHIRVNEAHDIPLSLADINLVQPTIIYHLALGPIAWAEALASYAYEHHLPFVYVSTASVFDDNAAGPYPLSAIVNARQGYGLYKYQCERAVLKVNPQAYVIRIGWQIDPEQRTDTNNMFRFFQDQLNQQGKIVVSDQYFPSSSWLDDTGKALVNLIRDHPGGLYHLNGNTNDSLYTIASKLNKQFSKKWIIEKDDTLKRNDVLLDSIYPLAIFQKLVNIRNC
jgi:nucleoside-diphosphate-sugar epimerase